MEAEHLARKNSPYWGFEGLGVLPEILMSIPHLTLAAHTCAYMHVLAYYTCALCVHVCTCICVCVSYFAHILLSSQEGGKLSATQASLLSMFLQFSGDPFAAGLKDFP